MTLAQHGRRCVVPRCCSTRRTRANTSFYPIDPRGLAVFDTPIDEASDRCRRPARRTIVPPSVDAGACCARRIDSLRTLAEATDGLAIVNSNDLAGGLKRVVDDLSSYYLLGYYSTGKLDGKFHSISVRVKRPGVRCARGAAIWRRRRRQPRRSARASGGGDGAGDRAGGGRRGARGGSGDRAAVGLRARRAAAAAAGGRLEAGRHGVGGDVGRRRARRRRDDRRRWNDGFDATVTLTTPADATVGSGADQRAARRTRRSASR